MRPKQVSTVDTPTLTLALCPPPGEALPKVHCHNAKSNYPTKDLAFFNQCAAVNILKLEARCFVDSF